MPITRYFFDGRTAHAHFPGIGRYAVNLAQAMAGLLREDEELHILRDSTRQTLFDGFQASERTRIHETPISPFSPRQQWVIPRLLRQERANVYHSPYLLMPLFPGVPTLVTVHDLIPLLFPAESSPKARIFFRFALAAALRVADKVITVSEATRRDLLNAHPKAAAKTQVCLEGPAQGFAPASEEAISSAKARYKLPDRYLLYVGSNKPHKNLMRLAHAWSETKREKIVLAIAGVVIPGYPAPSETEGSLRLLGRVEDADLPALYSGAELFVFPSLYEGFGLPVLEAMACGAAVACSRCSSLPEVAGDAAVYFDPSDPDSIRQRVRDTLARPELLIELRRKSLLQAARFSWEQAARETLALYRALSRTGKGD
jgi:alpha-1,3-rhamnosyl/mannosyltransferase